MNKPKVVLIDNKYQVIVRQVSEDGWEWLSIKRIDRESIHDWRELQAIKTAICGEEREGLELYPAESRHVDTSNQYHIFVGPIEFKFPFGYGNRLIIPETEQVKGTKQRPFEKKGQTKIDETNKRVITITFNELSNFNISPEYIKETIENNVRKGVKKELAEWILKQANIEVY